MNTKLTDRVTRRGVGLIASATFVAIVVGVIGYRAAVRRPLPGPAPAPSGDRESLRVGALPVT